MSEITELLERFQRGPEVLAAAVAGAAGDELDYVPAAGKWSIRQILCHVADAEIVARRDPSRAPVTLLDQLRTYAEHAEKHAQQVRGLRAAYASR
jgi:hypothetical protein